MWFITTKSNIHIPTGGIFKPLEIRYIEYFDTVSRAGYCGRRAVFENDFGSCSGQFLNG